MRKEAGGEGAGEEEAEGKKSCPPQPLPQLRPSIARPVLVLRRSVPCKFLSPGVLGVALIFNCVLCFIGVVVSMTSWESVGLGSSPGLGSRCAIHPAVYHSYSG